MIFGVFVLVVVCLVGLLVARLRNAPAGRMFIAVRSNERAAAAVGINVARTKLLAFGLSAFIAGLGGCLFAYQQQTISPPSFAVFTSLSLLAMTYVASVGRIAGAVVAGVMLSSTGLLVTALDKAFNIGKYQLVVAGVLLTLTAIKQPDGIAASPPPPLVKLGELARPAAVVAARPRRRPRAPRGGRQCHGRDARPRGPVGGRSRGAAAFYGRAFGFERSSRSSCRTASAALMLRLPSGGRLELFEHPSSAAGCAPESPLAALATRGYGHFAVGTPDIEAVYARRWRRAPSRRSRRGRRRSRASASRSWPTPRATSSSSWSGREARSARRPGLRGGVRRRIFNARKPGPPPAAVLFAATDQDVVDGVRLARRARLAGLGPLRRAQLGGVERARRRAADRPRRHARA